MSQPFSSSESTSSREEGSFSETPRFIGAEEKRRLIFAHSTSRVSRDPVQRTTMWIGLAVAVIAIAGGWWVWAGAKVQTSISKNSESYRKMTAVFDDFTKGVKNNPVVQASQAVTSENNSSTFSEVLKAVLEGEKKKYDRDDLLAPGPASLAPHATSTNSVEPDGDQKKPFVDLDTTGLIPE